MNQMTFVTTGAGVLAALTVWVLVAQPQHSQSDHSGQSAPSPVPASVRAEHQHLHDGLAAAVKAGGRTGAAAEKLEQTLSPHFAKEEEFALPPLALLAKLGQGQFSPEMRPMLKLTERLRAEYPQMIREHQAIGAALKALILAAEAEERPEVATWAHELQMHARSEEEIAYPAALLVGEYLKLKFGDAAAQ